MYLKLLTQIVVDPSQSLPILGETKHVHDGENTDLHRCSFAAFFECCREGSHVDMPIGVWRRDLIPQVGQSACRSPSASNLMRRSGGGRAAGYPAAPV